jgi:hypothetical protein
LFSVNQRQLFYPEEADLPTSQPLMFISQA